ncbi:ABC transporter ATP-binding protein [Pseudodesulfovibrio piezophilus]|uniref:Lipid A export ATP-binding/permease protein MsbA n=1 Tax=Pseudodesulfovibrio piezophilus (strain DSM 21447 / JCM 15486 / C1TLV30) TaxID=1322246 RepID=M1WMD1_PSEP2|nr:ABC transporter transmembrane domain-containing protein [Pseudodesulfovibrio piezophilus]CCH49395.1 Lipid A export ATP-binding/permease protein MsbA [Pseudodesulfovibrio piezophilus C1TLV30]
MPLKARNSTGRGERAGFTLGPQLFTEGMAPSEDSNPPPFKGDILARNQKLHYMGNRYLLKRSISYFSSYKLRVVIATVAMLLYAPIAPALGWLTKYVTDEVLIARDIETLKLCIFGLLFLIITKGILQFFQVYVMNSTGILVLKDMRRDLFDKIIRLPMPFFAESEIGMLMSRVVSDVVAVRQCLPSVIMFVRQVFTLLGLIGTVIYLDAYLAFWSLVVMPIAMYPIIFFGKKVRKYGRKMQSELSGVNVVLEESFSGIKVIKAFANECRESFRFNVENKKLCNAIIRQIFYSESSSRVMDFVSAGAGAAVLWIGGSRVIAGIITPGDLTAFLVCLVQLYEPVKKINMSNNQIQQGLAGAERVFDIFDSPEILMEESGNIEFNGTLAELKFDNIHFSYPNAQKAALDGVSLSIEAGQRVAVVGPSGSGKTTLVNLLPRFYSPQQGDITLNGVPLQDYTLPSLRLGLGLVSQDTFLFNDTIKANIAYAREEYDQAEVEKAAKAAFAHDFIMEMPEGYDTIVGEGGVKISGGQKQRLTIARAIMKNPPLLILDEATSALDTESERVVQEALENLMQGRTSIVIAHRLSTILTADVIVVMEHGRIIATGTHTELLAACPLYDRLYKMQFDDITE